VSLSNSPAWGKAYWSARDGSDCSRFQACLCRRGRPSSSTSTAPIARVGLIALGQVRFESREALVRFQHTFSGATRHLFVCTYTKFEPLARVLSYRIISAKSSPVSYRNNPGIEQYFLLQQCMRDQRVPWSTYSALVRIRTDTTQSPQWAPPAVGGCMSMQTDLAYSASASTFLLVFRNVFDEMVSRRYHRHPDEPRALFPNFGNLLKSDMTRTPYVVFNTRWGWLDFPDKFFRREERLAWGAGQQIDAVTVKRRVHERYDEFMELHRSPERAGLNGSHWLDQTSHPVRGYCSETSLLHHVLEYVPVCPFPTDMRVSLNPRVLRCPTTRPCYQPPEASLLVEATRMSPLPHDSPPLILDKHPVGTRVSS